MKKVRKGSILNLKSPPRLHSLSHHLKIADHNYYLVQMREKKTYKVFYTWEQISVIRGRFPQVDGKMEELLQLGRHVEVETRWPECKLEALLQVRDKFWCQQDKNSKQESNQQEQDVEKQQEEEKESNQFINKLARKLKQQIPQPPPSKSSRKKSQIQQIQPQQSLTPQQSQQQEQQWVSESPQIPKLSKEYIQIKSISKYDKKRQQLRYLVQNIMGEQRTVNGKRLKQTNVYELIAFLEKILGFDK